MENSSSNPSPTLSRLDLSRSLPEQITDRLAHDMPLDLSLHPSTVAVSTPHGQSESSCSFSSPFSIASPNLPPPPPPTPLPNSGMRKETRNTTSETLPETLQVESGNAMDGIKGVQLFTGGKRGRTKSLNSGDSHQSQLKMVRQSFTRLCLTPPPNNRSPLSSLLSNLPSLVDHILSYIQRFPDLYGVKVSCSAFHQFTLSMLDLSFTSVTCLERLNLPMFKGLKTLDLRNTRVSSISGVRNCSRLELLGLSATGISTIDEVGECPNLKYLFLVHTKVQDLSPISKCKKLEVLNCSGTSVSDLTPLRECSKLKELMLISTRVKNLESLAGLGELSLLDLSFTPVSDINCLAQLQKLEVLRLGFCQVQEEGWDVVSKMTGLKTLQCGQLCSTMPKVMNKIREGGVTVTF